MPRTSFLSLLVPTLRVGTFCLTLCVACVARTAHAADDLGLSVPPGFEVSLFADDDLAHDIYSMTIDAKGRVVAAGRNYVKILHDDNADGRADRATLFSNKPASGAHGMYFDGPDLVCTGDDAVMRLRDTNDDGVADGAPEVWTRLRHPEHGANGVVKGPDGWFYVICGNDAEVTEKHATTSHSPVKKPNCGAIVRFSPDGKQSEIFAHGFRNPYDLDFNERGHLFTVDADGERDQYLPWYAPNRLFDVAQGMHHGWVLRGWTRSWNRPEYFPDNVERLVEIGRGSPTGLVCYRHRAFPPKYRGGIFSACWTLGNIYYFPLTPKGSTYTSQKEIFLRPTGQIGFAPVDLAVGPAGDLFIAIGGRGTRGGVFRVVYKGELPEEPKPKGALEQVLAADQPLASWSRARWLPIAKRLGHEALEKAVYDPKAPLAEALRGFEVLTEVFNGIRPHVVNRAFPDPQAPKLGRAVWSLAHWAHGRPIEGNADFDAVWRWGRGAINSHDVPELSRAGWAAMLVFPEEEWRRLPFKMQFPVPMYFTSSLANEDRRVRALARHGLLKSQFGAAENRMSAAVQIDKIADNIAHSPSERREMQAAWIRIGAQWLRLAEVEAKPDHPVHLRFFVERCLNLIGSTKESSISVESLRLLQLACGDVRIEQKQPDLYAGYAPARSQPLPVELRDKLAAELTDLLPTGDEPVDREIARLLGMIAADDPDQLEKLTRCLQGKTTVESDIHYLIVLSLLPGKRSDNVRTLVAESLVALLKKVIAADYQVSRNWPLVVGELFDELCKRDPGLAHAVVNDADFGLPDHTLFAERMPKELRAKAARKIFDAAIKARDEARWSAEMVALVGDLPDADVLPKLRELWDDEPGLRDSIATVLARSPVEMDRSRLVAVLVSPDPKTIVTAAKALRSLAKPGQPGEIADALRMLREYCVPGKHADVRRDLMALLTHWTGQKITIDERNSKNLVDAYRPWFDWFVKTHPAEAAKLAASGEIDASAWAKRLAAIDWTTGDAARGRKVFDARSCNRCHGANSRLGPDLTGVTRRFSRADLLTSIIDPNKDVSPLYQTTQLTTKTGQTHVGILIYESPESSLLQTGPDTTIRITDEEVSKRRPSRQSLMPTGLLNGATDQEIVDLFEYMDASGTR
jgi:putative membrane-bound dehydrogenase-like protein